jgi:photosystem II stability/assembly factor-like uncharacterized protein
VPNTIAFRDRLHGVLGAGWESCVDSAFHCRPQGTISLTADGGRTWRVAARTPRPVVAVGYDGTALIARYDDGENLRSNDGGRRWSPDVAPTPLTSPCPAGMLASVAGSWVLCTGEGGAGNMAKAVYRITSTGAHRVAYTPFSGRGGYGGISSFGYPLGIAGEIRGGFGLIWESRGTLYVTRNGGHHWQGLPKLVRPDLDFGDSACVLPGGSGFALVSLGGSERRRLLETTDSGRTWRLVHRWR